MSIHIDHTAAFANFWSRSFPGVPCPPVPKTEKDLNLTAKKVLKAEDPKLYQNLFAGNTSTLPADVLNRRNLGQNVPADADALAACGLQWEAEELRRRAQIAETQHMNQRIDESRQVQEMHRRRREQWQSMTLLVRLAASPVSAESAARARAEWGITGP